jgi:hypothetical protein
LPTFFIHFNDLFSLNIVLVLRFNTFTEYYPSKSTLKLIYINVLRDSKTLQDCNNMTFESLVVLANLRT